MTPERRNRDTEPAAGTPQARGGIAKRVVLLVCIAACCIAATALFVSSREAKQEYSKTEAALAEPRPELPVPPPLPMPPGDASAPPDFLQAPSAFSGNGVLSALSAEALRLAREAFLRMKLEAMAGLGAAYDDYKARVEDYFAQWVDYESLKSAAEANLATWEALQAKKDVFVAQAKALKSRVLLYLVMGGVLVLLALAFLVALLRALFALPGGAAGAAARLATRTSCPHCAESVHRRAVVCKHCGRDIA